MKIIRLIGISLLVGLIVLNFMDIPFSTFLINHSYIYAFASGFEAHSRLVSVASCTLFLSLNIFSFAIGLLLTALIYCPIEKVILINLKNIKYFIK